MAVAILEDMIAQISGEVIRKLDSGVVVDVHGVGYEVTLPSRLVQSLQVGDGCTFVTYHHIREQAQELYGFDTNDALVLFEQLIGISGVGPKSALSVFSLGSVTDIRTAIRQHNSAFIARAQGIGKKSAERICIELKDKFDDLTDTSYKLSAMVENDAYAALIALGYNAQQVTSALAAVDTSLPAEEQVKQALQGIR